MNKAEVGAAAGGKVAVNISGTYTPQELRGVLRKLCEAHADLLPQGRGLDGLPRFAFRPDRFTVEHAGRGAIRWLVETPAFGWVGAEIELVAAEAFADRIHALVAEQLGDAGGGIDGLPPTVPH